ncbi:MAG: flagellar protein FlaG [Anaerolineales bacterium]|nr:flagellar protein FlaG [Anaerolineales bacterium]
MSDNMISTASSVDLSLVASQAEAASYVKASSGKPAKVESKEVSHATETKAAKAETSSSETSTVNPMGDFTLEFQVDDTTNDVTVYVLDRNSHEVVRTIPPEELNNLNPGDLLQLFV